MSITITIAGVDRWGGVGRSLGNLLPVLGAVLLPIAEDFVPGLRIAIALTQVHRRAGIGVMFVDVAVARRVVGLWASAALQRASSGKCGRFAGLVCHEGVIR